jgi:hypothetical protein
MFITLPKKQRCFCFILAFLILVIFPYQSPAFQTLTGTFTLSFLKLQIAQSENTFLNVVEDPEKPGDIKSKEGSIEDSPRKQNDFKNSRVPHQGNSEVIIKKDKMDTNESKKVKPSKPIDSIVTHGLSGNNVLPSSDSQIGTSENGNFMAESTENAKKNPDKPIDSIVTHGLSKFE